MDVANKQKGRKNKVFSLFSSFSPPAVVVASFFSFSPFRRPVPHLVGRGYVAQLIWCMATKSGVSHWCVVPRDD